MKVLKKLGQVLLTFVPFIITMIIQLIMSIPVTFYYMFYVAATQEFPKDMNALMEWLINDLLMGDYAVILTACWGIASMITFIFWYKKQKKDYTVVPLKKCVNLYSIGGLALMVCGLQLAIQYVYSYVEMLKPEWFYEYNQLLGMENYSEIGTIIMILYGVIVAPIHEEYLIRGVTQNFAKKAMPFWLANIVQALIFGVLHMNIIQGSYAFIIGLLLGYIMHKAKNIWIPIIFHFFFNLFGTFVPLNAFEADFTSGYILVTIIGIAIMCAGIVLFELTTNNRDNALSKN